MKWRLNFIWRKLSNWNDLKKQFSVVNGSIGVEEGNWFVSPVRKSIFVHF